MLVTVVDQNISVLTVLLSEVIRINCSDLFHVYDVLFYENQNNTVIYCTVIDGRGGKTEG